MLIVFRSGTCPLEMETAMYLFTGKEGYRAHRKKETQE
jgi:hypothetical protein